MLIVTNATGSRYYESIEFNVSTGQTNYDVASNQATFGTIFGEGKVVPSPAREMILRTDQTITVKLNSSSNHSITVTAGDSPFSYQGEVSNVYITNASGSTASIKLLLLP
jgi:hypothetical protein